MEVVVFSGQLAVCKLRVSCLSCLPVSPWYFFVIVSGFGNFFCVFVFLCLFFLGFEVSFCLTWLQLFVSVDWPSSWSLAEPCSQLGVIDLLVFIFYFPSKLNSYAAGYENKIDDHHRHILHPTTAPCFVSSRLSLLFFSFLFSAYVFAGHKRPAGYVPFEYAAGTLRNHWRDDSPLILDLSRC